MLPPPRDNQRQAVLLSLLTVVWVKFQSEDRGYTTELRGALRKYGDVAAVPQGSVVWLGRVHGREAKRVRQDLAAAAAHPTVFDPEAPLHLEPALHVQLYLDLGFVGLWLLLTFAGVMVAAPVIYVVNRQAQPPPRRPPSDLAWQ
jgi:hypothetical protein